jgi:dienelactone hydrolase
VVTYPGAKHAFTNPDADKYGQEFKLPLAYNAVADKASWEEGLKFLDDSFKVK